MNNNFYNKRLKNFARELRSETVSKAEKRIWKALLSRKQMGVRFKRQRPILNFIVDFYCPELNLVIEIDGNSHDRKQSYDYYRENKLKEIGCTILRFREGEVNWQLDEVSNKIDRVIRKLSFDKDV